MKCLETHITNLADHYAITIEPLAPGGSPMAQRHKRIIYIPPVVDETTYLDALHEIGHLVTFTNAEKEMVLTRECRAWGFALGNAKEVTKRGRLYVKKHLQAYYRKYCFYTFAAEPFTKQLYKTTILYTKLVRQYDDQTTTNQF